MANVCHETVALPGLWRVAWFGGLSHAPTSSSTDLRIQTYLTPLGSVEEVADGQRLVGAPPVPRLLPVGELPLLHLNAVLQDGVLCTDPRANFAWGAETHYAQELDFSRENITVISRFARDESGCHIIPLSKESRMHPADRAALFVAVGDGRDPFANLIPAVEVFRFFYATSSVLARTILSPAVLDVHANFWSIDKSAVTPDGLAVLWLRRRMLDADARFIARFAFDKYALSQMQEIYLYAAAKGPHDGRRMIKALPPFEGSARVRFRFIPIHRKDGAERRRLITQLLQCSYPPPFSSLKWDRDNDGRPSADEAGDLELPKRALSLIAPPDDGALPTTRLTQQPAGFLSPTFRLKEEDIFDRFPSLRDVPAEKLPQEETSSKREPKSWKFLMAKAFSSSVIQGRSSGELVSHAIIEGLVRKPQIAPERTESVNRAVGEESYRHVLGLLRAINHYGLGEVTFLAVLDSIAWVSETEFNVFPPDVDDKRFAWLYVDREKFCRRMVIVAKVRVKGEIRYVLEFQQRTPRECATQIVRTAAGSGDVSHGLLAALLLDCARRSSAALANVAIYGLKSSTVRHYEKDCDQAAVARFVERVFH